LGFSLDQRIGDEPFVASNEPKIDSTCDTGTVKYVAVN
jgi:hypothetical protein